MLWRRQLGDVFSFGKGMDGRLGHGEEDWDQFRPKQVEALKGRNVVQVSAGGYHSLVLTESGDVFSFGMGRYGRLGHGDEESQYLPKLVEALKGKKVVEVGLEAVGFDDRALHIALAVSGGVIILITLIKCYTNMVKDWER